MAEAVSACLFHFSLALGPQIILLRIVSAGAKIPIVPVEKLPTRDKG